MKGRKERKKRKEGRKEENQVGCCVTHTICIRYSFLFSVSLCIFCSSLLLYLLIFFVFCYFFISSCSPCRMVISFTGSLCIYRNILLPLPITSLSTASTSGSSSQKLCLPASCYLSFMWLFKFAS